MTHRNSTHLRADKVVGKAQKAWGELTINPRHKAAGEYKQAKGAVKDKAGDALAAVEDLAD